MSGCRSCRTLLSVAALCEGLRNGGVRRIPPHVAPHRVLDIIGYQLTRKSAVKLIGGLNKAFADLTSKDADGVFKGQRFFENYLTPEPHVNAILFQGLWKHDDGGNIDISSHIWSGLHEDHDSSVEKIYYLARDEAVGREIEDAVKSLGSSVDSTFVRTGVIPQPTTLKFVAADRYWLKFFKMQQICEGDTPTNVILAGRGKTTPSLKFKMSESTYVDHLVFKQLTLELLACERVGNVMISWDSSYDGGVWLPFIEQLPQDLKARVGLVHACPQRKNSKQYLESAQWRQSTSINGRTEFIAVEMTGVTNFMNRRAVHEMHRFEEKDREDLAVCSAAFEVETLADYKSKNMYRNKAQEAVMLEYGIASTPSFAGNLEMKLADFAMELNTYKIGGVVAPQSSRSQIEKDFKLNVLQEFIVWGSVKYPDVGGRHIVVREWEDGDWTRSWPEKQRTGDIEGYGQFGVSLELIRKAFATQWDCEAAMENREAECASGGLRSGSSNKCAIF